MNDVGRREVAPSAFFPLGTCDGSGDVCFVATDGVFVAY